MVVSINLVLKLRDKYIENNKFYLYNSGVFFLNSLARIASYVVLTLCFIYDRIEVARQQINQQAGQNSFSKLGNLVRNLVNSVPLVKVIFDSLAELSSFIH